MKQQWQLANDKIATLSNREKILLLITGLIIIPGILDFFLIQPVRDESNNWTNQIERINQRMLSFNQQQQDLPCDT